MGAPATAERNEESKPAHLRRVGAFYIGRTEVTNAAFQAFVDRQPNGYQTRAEQVGSSFVLGGADELEGLFWRRPRPDSDSNPDPNLPVVHVS